MVIDKTKRYFIYLIPYIEPQMFKTPGYEIGDKIFLVLKLLSFFCIFIEYINYKICRIKKYTWCIILMSCVQFAIFISTILNHGSLTRFLGPAIASISMLMLSDLIFSSNWKKCLKYIENYISILYVINLITHILRMLGAPFYPSFLGIDNRWIYFLLPWTIIAFINDYLKNEKLTYSIYIYIFSFLSVIMVWAVGAMVSFFILPFAYFAIKLSLKNYSIIKSCVARVVFVFFTVINGLLVTNRLLEFFKTTIREILHKDITLSGRTYLWNGVIELLYEKTLLGNGMQSQDYDLNFFLTAGLFLPGTEVNHPHNHLLYLAYHGGLLCVTLFLILLYIVMKHIDRVKDKKLVCIYLASIVAIFTAALVDTLDFSLFYLLFSIFMCMPAKKSKLNLSKVKCIRIERK